jgi:predicted nucleotidyltransferase
MRDFNKNYKKFNTKRNKLDENAFDLTMKEQLHPGLWDGDLLKPDIRQKLLKITMDFKNYLEILKDEDIIDIRLTGSLTNYNYSEHSDIDVLIVADFNKLGHDRRMLETYFRKKKMAWIQSSDIKVEGFEVEVGVDNVDGSVGGTRSMRVNYRGHYSLTTNQWITRPEQFDGLIDKEDVYRRVQNITKRLRQLVEKKASKEEFRKLFVEASKTRRSGMKDEGVWSSRNIAWKVLKRSGVIKEITSFF